MGREGLPTISDGVATVFVQSGYAAKLVPIFALGLTGRIRTSRLVGRQKTHPLPNRVLEASTRNQQLAACEETADERCFPGQDERISTDWDLRSDLHALAAWLATASLWWCRPLRFTTRRLASLP